MPENVWRVIVIDDDEDNCRQISEHYSDWEYSGHRLEIATETDFGQALSILERQRYDLVILDVFRGQPAEDGDKQGKQILEEIKQRRFIPVILYTALPASVADLQTVLVKVAEKVGTGHASLDGKVREYLDLPLLRINRELVRHFDEALRDYLWQYIPGHWEEIAASGEDDATLAYLLCRRVAASLDIDGAEKLALRLRPSPQETSIAQGKAHPLRYYIMPPEPGGYRTGDLLKDRDDSYWIVLTPWCDLISQGTNPPRADHVLLARADHLSQYQQYADWIAQEEPSQTSTENLTRVLRAPDTTPPGRQSGRHYFLPGALDLPDLVIDLQQTRTHPLGNMDSFTKVATLDSPFAEAVVSSFTRFVSRVGTPDLDIEKVLANLRSRGTGPGRAST